jgi:Lrp/AsnC family transcriptional regulator for asnA, asnC and gidA
MKPLDSTDRAIISHLQYDGRKAYTDIAAAIGVSEGAVRHRVKRLTESGVLQIVGIVEPQFLDLDAAGMIGVNVHSGQIDSVAQQIAQLPEVSYLFMASGEFDLFVEVYCRDREHFVTFLSNKLQAIPGVAGTETFMILKMYKLSYRWGQANHTPPVKLQQETVARAAALPQ